MGAAKMVLMLASVLGAEDVTVVQFSADWCGHCQKMRSTVRRLEADGFPIKHVNVDHQKELIKTHRVRALPTFILMKDGREQKRLEGEVTYTQLSQMMEQAGYRPQPADSSSTTIRAQSPDGSSNGILSSALERFKGIGGNAAPPAETKQTPAQATAARTAVASAQSPAAAAVPAQRNAAQRNAARRPAAEQVSPEQLAMRASVKLRIEDATGFSFGSGTIIDTHGQDALVLTCGHIFRDSAGKGQIEVQIYTPGGVKSVPGTLLAWEPDYRDIGLIAIRPGAFVTAVPVASAPTYRSNDRVFSVGCDHGADPSLLRGAITGLDRFEGSPNIEVSGTPALGRSGGGLFNAKGELIGVCKLANPTDKEGIYASVKSVHFHLDKTGLSHVYAPRSTPDNPVGGAVDARNAAPQLNNTLADNPAPKRLPASKAPSAPFDFAETSRTPTPNLTQVGNIRQPAKAIAEALQKRNADTEVIVIMRQRNNPQGPSEVLVVDNATDDLIASIRQAVDRSKVRANATMAANTRPAEIQNADRRILMRGQSDR